MAEKSKKAAAEPVELSDLDLGRIIHLIRGEWHGTSSSWGYSREWKKTRRRFTDTQIAKLLGMDIERLKKLDDAYTITIDRWGGGRLEKRIVEFVKKEKRWPRKSDFGLKNGMPSPSTYSNAGAEQILRSWLAVSKNCRSLHPNVILGVGNVTWRAELIQRFGGYEEIVKKGGGTIRQQDDYGILWELPPEPDVEEDVALWLEVTNATAVGGEREHFFLRMPPEMTTAKQAVEWSFSIPTGQLEEFAGQT